MTCGFTPDEIRAMTWNDVKRLHAYWEKQPPTHLLVAAFVGFKPQEKPKDDFAAFLNDVPQVI